MAHIGKKPDYPKYPLSNGGEKIMLKVLLDQKYELATQVICKQGIVPFPVNDTTISILKQVIEDSEVK